MKNKNACEKGTNQSVLPITVSPVRHDLPKILVPSSSRFACLPGAEFKSRRVVEVLLLNNSSFEPANSLGGKSPEPNTDFLEPINRSGCQVVTGNQCCKCCKRYLLEIVMFCQSQHDENGDTHNCQNHP